MYTCTALTYCSSFLLVHFCRFEEGAEFAVHENDGPQKNNDWKLQ